ncbi:MAG: hypothetical protein ACRESK_02015 [Gammaproteobacteria bacterium]
MTIKPYLIITAVIFVIVAVVHLLRLTYQWPVLIGNLNIPMWVSCAGLVVASVLFVWGFLLLRKL